MRLTAFVWLGVAVLTILFSTFSCAEPAIVTCQSGQSLNQIASLETPYGSASGRLCLDDGDSFTIGPTFVRLEGIDAPRLGRTCRKSPDMPARCRNGAAAMDALAELISIGAACSATKFESRNRWLAVCLTKDGRDMAETLVHQGYACAAAAYSDKYVAAQAEARQAGAGLWGPGSAFNMGAFCDAKRGKRDKARR